MTTSRSIPAQTGVRHLPGDRDVWVFIMAELMMFGLFFVAFVVHRNGDIALFNAGQATLDRRLGVLNTLVLIISSWAVICAVNAARMNRKAAVARYLAGAIAMALTFVAVKYVEYSAKFGAGISITTNDFYMFYFSLTMIHLAHVIGGTVILVVMLLKATKGKYHSKNLKGIETGASFWHMVDLLWIFLFPLLYLLK